MVDGFGNLIMLIENLCMIYEISELIIREMAHVACRSRDEESDDDHYRVDMHVISHVNSSPTADWRP